MAHFLTGLLNRAQTQGDSIQRRRPALFESDAGLSLLGGQLGGIPLEETASGNEARNLGVSHQASTGPEAFQQAQAPESRTAWEFKPVAVALPRFGSADESLKANHDDNRGGEQNSPLPRTETVREIRIEPALPNVETRQSMPPVTVHTRHLETIREIHHERPIHVPLVSTDQSPQTRLRTPIGEEQPSPNIAASPKLTGRVDDIAGVKPKRQPSSESSKESTANSSRRIIATPLSVARDATPQPTIHVSIGRIEVRAVPAPTANNTRPQRPAAPRLSLEDYLRQRNGGRR